MCAMPAQVAGVERIALASPPGPDGRLHPVMLAAAALCGVEEIYAIGGAQAIFALAYGTETIAPVDVIAGPGNAWVQEAKRAVVRHGRDRLARRAVGADGDRRPRHRPGVGRARPLRAGRARRRKPAGRRRGRGARPRRRSPTRDRGAAGAAPVGRRRAAGAGPRPRARGRDRARQRLRARAPRDLRGGRGPARRADHDRRLRLRRPLGRDRLRRLRRRAPTTCCRPAAPAASPARSARATFRRRISTVEIGAEAAAALAPQASTPSPAPRASPSTASRR